ncbi:hypothetical protein ABNF65_05400 [Paenibacillus larvae]
MSIKKNRAGSQKKGQRTLNRKEINELSFLDEHPEPDRRQVFQITSVTAAEERAKSDQELPVGKPGISAPSKPVSTPGKPEASSAPKPKLPKQLIDRRESKKSGAIVYTDDIVDGAVTGEKLANRSIDESKIKPQSIGTYSLKDGSIESSKLVNFQQDCGFLRA